MNAQLTTDIPTLDPIHDNRHQLDSDSLARESLVYMIALPEKMIGGFLYTWVKGNGLAGVAIGLFGPGIGETPLIEKYDDIPVADEMNFDNWQVKGLRVELGEPLKTASVYYQSEAIDIEYHFEALQPAYAYGAHPDGCPPWIADDRFEQHGHVKGHIRCLGRKITLDGFGLRDHSWGTREWGVNQHWKWIHAQAGPELDLHFMQLDARGDRLLRGYVRKGQHIAAITSVEVKAQYDDRLYPQKLEIEVHDSARRTTHIKASAFAVLPFEPDPLVSIIESPLQLSIDDQIGSGWCEILWPNSLLDYTSEKRRKK